MFRSRLLPVTFFFALFPAVTFAQELKAESIRDTISGRNVVLSTMGFQFPLFYANDGSVTGDGTSSGLAAYFTPRETGKWWVESDQLCQKFPTWYKGKTWCFKLERVGVNRLRWQRDDGFTGKAWING
jgi:hypothetical protein